MTKHFEGPQFLCAHRRGQEILDGGINATQSILYQATLIGAVEALPRKGMAGQRREAKQIIPPD